MFEVFLNTTSIYYIYQLKKKIYYNFTLALRRYSKKNFQNHITLRNSNKNVVGKKPLIILFM